MKWENGEKEREGEEKKLGRQGGLVSRARLARVCPARQREEEGDGTSPVSLGNWLGVCIPQTSAQGLLMATIKWSIQSFCGFGPEIQC